MTYENKITKAKDNSESSIPVRRLRARRRDHIMHYRSGGLKFAGLGI
jgi:hypothetical protein